MPKRKQLPKRQLAVIDEFFSGELDEQAVLEKHKVSRNLYNKWLVDESFTQEFDRRIASAHRQSAALIARYAPLAAAKLVQLTESDSQETARKTCLDIISMPNLSYSNAEKQIDNRQSQIINQPSLSSATASRLLAALAEQKDDFSLGGNSNDNLNKIGIQK